MVAFSHDMITETLKLIGAGEMSSFDFYITVGSEFKAKCNLECDQYSALVSKHGLYPLCGVQTVGIIYTDGNGDMQTEHVGYADVSGVEEIVVEMWGYVNRLWG